VAAFVGNFHFATQGTQYFTASQPPSTLQQFWSLAVEEQFYLVWPVLFLLITRPWRWLSPVTRLAVALIVIVGISFAWCVIQTDHNEVWAFFSPLTRAWELALGALLAVLGPRLRGRSPRSGLIMASVGWVTIVLCAWFYSTSTLWPGAAAAVPVLAAGLIIAGGSLRAVENSGDVVQFPPLQWLGNVSYSLYLVHWPIIAIATQYASGPLALTARLELVAASVALAAALYYVIENPIRKSHWLAKRHLMTFALGGTLIGLSYIAIYWHLSHY
jgi:peptidoglycan/LPS O-acetylase OafA/YrhL